MAKIALEKSAGLDKFVKEIKDQLGDKILGLYLFGSVAKGTAKPGSDIDVLIIYSGIMERQRLEIASDISFDIACQHGEMIEVVPMSKEEYDRLCSF